MLDADGDGDLDLYWVNGATLDDPFGGGNALYVNEAGGFRDLAAEAGVRGRGWGMGAASADYDNDGDADLYVTCLQADLLYRNDTRAAPRPSPRSLTPGSSHTAGARGRPSGLRRRRRSRPLRDRVRRVRRRPDPTPRLPLARHARVRRARRPAGRSRRPAAQRRRRPCRRDGGSRRRPGAGRVRTGGAVRRRRRRRRRGPVRGQRLDAQLPVPQRGRPLHRCLLEAGVAYAGRGTSQAGMGAAWGDVDGDLRPDCW